jgi:hypothetical protein
MPTAGKPLAAGTLTSTLTTTLYTVPSGKTTRITHIAISNGGTAGTITLSITYNSLSGTPTVEIFNAVAISANSDPKEFFDIFLAAGDVVKGGAATTAVAKYHIHGVEES